MTSTMPINYGTFYTYWGKLPSGRTRTKKEQQDLKQFWNKHARRATNMEAGRVIIDEEQYYIDVKENFVYKIVEA